MRSHPELAAERAVLEHARRRLDAIREEAKAVAAEVVAEGRGGLAQHRLERDVRVTYSYRRLAGLNIGRDPLVVGRTDDGDGEVLRIGRIAIDDEDRDPLVIDWRAAAAEPFYRATPLDPRGLVRRRHYHYRRGELEGLEDELFDVEGAADHGLTLVGEGALLAALGRRRTGRMADIVATIQREQDVVIRSPLGGVLVVQGGPGTGKTAVALHRAAFLLYTHRFPLETTGVLLVGPNPLFLRYVEEVLPSLGEHAVTLATPGSLRDDVEVVALDSPTAARVKGDLRMIEVLRRGMNRMARPLAEDLVVGVGPSRLVLTVEASRRLVARARRQDGSYRERGRRLRASVLRHFRAEMQSSRERLMAAGRLGPDATPRSTKQSFDRQIRAHPEIKAALQRMWPDLTATQVVSAMLTMPSLLARAADGILDPAEVDAILRPRSLPAAVPWTPADVALIEEAALLLGDETDPEAKVPPPAAITTEDEREAAAELIDRVMADQMPECPSCGSSLDWHLAERRWVCPHRDCGRRYEPEAVLSPAQQHLFESVLGHLTAGTGRAEDDEEPESPGTARTFGHVVVDEAQDLSPLQWRMLGRRCPGRSMTVSGDLNQASGAWAPSGWAEALAPALEGAGGVPVREAQLTVNYRTPQEVMDVAQQVLAHTAPGRSGPRSVRTVGHRPECITVDRSEQRAAAAALAARAASVATAGGRTAVIAPAADRRPVVELLGEAGGVGLEDAITVLSLDDAKGLEFDAVVVVEPADLVAEHPHGASALYVALTRTTDRLTIVAAKRLPAPLAACFPP